MILKLQKQARVWKKQLKILDSEQKEILAIYQTCKAYITKSKVNLLEEGVKKNK